MKISKTRTEYQIIGSDNYWYASCLYSLEEVRDEIQSIKEYPADYGREESPETLYIYKTNGSTRLDLD